jgi:hypothetical protein
MENDYININEKLPEKGIDIIGIDEYGDKYYCYRCSCNNLNCKEWRCSMTGYGMIIDITKWQYIKINENENSTR